MFDSRVFYRHFLGKVIFFTLMGVFVGIFLVLSDSLDIFCDIVIIHKFSILKTLELFCYVGFELIIFALPIGVIFGVVVTYNMLKKNNELSAMSSIGLSNFQLIKPALLIGVSCFVFMILTCQFLSPVLVKRKKDVIDRMFGMDIPSISFSPKIFNNLSEDFGLYCEEKDGNVYKNCLILCSNILSDKKNDFSSLIESGEITVEKGSIFSNFGKMLILENNGSVSMKIDFESYELPFKNIIFDQSIYNISRSIFKPFSLTKLLKLRNKSDLSNRERRSYDVDFQQKIALSASCIIFSILASILTVGKHGRGEVNSSFNIIIVILIATIHLFYMPLSDLFFPLYPPFIVKWIPNFFAMIICFFGWLNREYL